MFSSKFPSADLDVWDNPGYGKPKVYRARVRVDKIAIHTSSGDYKLILAMAAEQAKEMIRPNIGTARGEYKFLCENDQSFMSLGQYLVVTATWTSQCHAIKPPKPALQPKDIFGD